MSKFVCKVLSRSARQIEYEAAEVIRAFAPERLRSPGKLRVIPFFEDFLRDRFRLDTGVSDQLGFGVLGVTHPNGTVLVSEETYQEAENGGHRARFTIAHEAGHGILHRHQLQEQLVENRVALYRREDIPAPINPEWQANVFAASLLMPRDMVLDVIDGECQSIWARKVSKIFGVSFMSAVFRLNKVA